MDILQTLQNGIEESAARLFTEYRDRLYAVALTQCGGDHAAAEDLVMSTFEVYLTKKELFDPTKGTLLSWLMTVMRNLRCNDVHKANRSGIMYLAPEELDLIREMRELDNSTDAGILAKSDEEEIARILETLPQKVREAMHLRFFESMPVTQIAKLLAVSPGAIRVRLHYGRKILQKRLAKAGKKPAALALALFLCLGAVFAAVKTGGFGLLSEENLPTEERSGSAPIVKSMAATVDVGSGESAASVAGTLDDNEVLNQKVTGGTKMNTGKLAVAAVMASAMTINNADAATIRLSDFAVTETEVVSAKLAVTIETDEPCELYAVYGHGDFCRTNLLDEAATSAVGREFDLANLAPGTDYSVYLYAQNPGDAVARTELLPFATVAEDFAPVSAGEEKGEWCMGRYDNATWVPAGGNVLAGLVATASSGALESREGNSMDPGVLTDGVVPTSFIRGQAVSYVKAVAICNNAVLTWTFPGPTNISEVTIYSIWESNGRNAIDINSIEVQSDNEGEWRSASKMGVSYRPTDKPYSLCVTLRPENDEKYLARDVTSLRVNFAGQKNGYCGYTEIEAVNIPRPSPIPPTITSLSYDGRMLVVDISREGSLPSNIKVCGGATYGGATLADWTVLDVITSFREGENTRSVAIEDIPDEMHYLRLFSEYDGWTQTVLLDELSVSRDPQVKLTEVAVSRVGLVDATLSLNIASIGFRAETYDLAVRLSHDGVTTTRTLCTGCAETGPATFVLDELKPGTEYTMKLIASNGLAGGDVETPAYVFHTRQEHFVPLARFVDPVEYVESTGAQTLNTGVHPSPLTLSQMKFSMLAGSGGVFYGYREGSDDKNDYRFFAKGKYPTGFYLDMPAEGAGTTGARVNGTMVSGSHAICEFELGNHYMKNLETGAQLTGAFQDFPTKDYSLMLFDVGNYGQVYYLRIFEGDLLVRDYIPVRNAAGEGFLYDLVEENFAVNAGTSSLLVGPLAKSVRVESVVRNDNTVTVALSLRGFPDIAELTAYVGDVYGGDEVTNWTAATSVGLPDGLLYTTVSFDLAEELADLTYLRFRSSTAGWSQTLMLREISREGATGMRIEEVGEVAVSASDVTMTIVLEDGGAGIEGDVFAVTAFQYFNGVDATVITQTNRVLKTVGAGEYAVSLKNLCPQSRYELSFLVTTASGTEVSPAKEPLALVTDAEEYPDGSSRLSVTTGASKSGKLQFTATCANAAKEDVTLYAAYGKSYGGDDPSCWGHVEAIGAVWEADEAVLSSQTPAMGRSTTYLRFFTSDGRWSNTVFIPAIGFHPKQGFAVILR